jgi:cardiolipin synthase
VPYAYLPDLTRAGVKVFIYEKCFMHQKVMLVDDDYGAVGTANLDNRSFRLNFEVTCLVSDPGSAGKLKHAPRGLRAHDAVD